MPALANIGSLLLLIVLIYSILGMYLFADIKLNGALSVDANFQSIGGSFILLIQISTGENWPDIMAAVSR